MSMIITINIIGLILIHNFMIMIRAVNLSHSVHRQQPSPSQLLSQPGIHGLRWSTLFLQQKTTHTL